MVASMSCSPTISWYAEPAEAANFCYIEDFTPWVLVPMVDTTSMVCGPCEVEQNEHEEELAEEDLPSIGSRGHPHKCADACKYACKPRGCKDGLLCDRCHLCDWRNRKKGGKSGDGSADA